MGKWKERFEIIIDGKVNKTTVGYYGLEREESAFREKIKDKGFEEIESSSNGSSGYILYFNEGTLESSTFAYREITRFVDANGEKIYYGDLIAYGSPDGQTYDLFESAFDDGKYYIRSTASKMWDSSKTPITGEEIKKSYYVVHKVFEKIK